MAQSLHKIFNPTQGMLSFTHDSRLYREYKPNDTLEPFVACYWISPAEQWQEKSERVYQRETIVPDGCVDIIFDINRTTQSCTSTIVGMMDKPILTMLNYNNIQTFGIRFLPAGVYPFIKSPIRELTNKIQRLQDVLGDAIAHKLVNNISAATSTEEMIKLADRFLVERLITKGVKPHNSIQNLLYRVIQSSGNVTVRELATLEIISERHLRRLFDRWVGVSPKAFCRIVRFQTVLDYASAQRNVDWVSVALGAGYYDQSHFINDFKAMYGRVPTSTLSN